jgi:hypothetical protein
VPPLLDANLFVRGNHQGLQDSPCEEESLGR